MGGVQKRETCILITLTSSTKLRAFGEISRVFKNRRTSTPSILICLGHLEINITILNPNVSVRILAL